MKYFSFKKKFKLNIYKINLKTFKNIEYFYIKIYYLNNKFKIPRLGILIYKKFVKLSNKRNYIKRIIIENFRLNKNILYNLDYIIKIKNFINFNKSNINNIISNEINLFFKNFKK